MRRLGLFILCLCWMRASGQPASVLHKPYAVQYAFLDSLRRVVNNLKKEEATAIMSQAKKWAESHDDKELAEALSLVSLKISIENEPQLNVNEKKLRDLALSANESGYRLLEADAWQALGIYYWNNDVKHSLALENLMEAYNIYEQFSIKDFPPKQEYLFELGGSYFRYEDYDNAIKYLKEAIALKPTENNIFSNTINNTLGLCYQKSDQLDSAASYFQTIYTNGVKNKDTVWVGIAAGNIGNVLFLQKRYKEAIPMLETDVTNSLATRQIRSAAGSMYKLSVVYYLQNDMDKSLQLMKGAVVMCEGLSFWPNYPLAEQFYTQLSKVYAAKNDMHLAWLYADSALTAKDSVAATRNKLNVARSQEKIDYIKHKLETGKLSSEKRIQELLRNGLIALILMVCVIGILFINRQRLKQKKLEAEKKNAESELDIAAIQLNNIRQSVQEKNKIIEHFTTEIDRLKTGEVQKTDDDLLYQLETAIILTDEQWDQFRAVFEKVHKGFFSSLKKKIPDLTPAEIRFLALTKLKLSSKEMASMLGISTNAIRMYRHRLRRKLDLDKEDMIEELVAGI